MIRFWTSLALAGLLLLGTAQADPGPRTTPDPLLTPGAARSLPATQICATKWGKDARAVTAAMKRQVLAAYRIPPAAWHVVVDGKRRAAFEIDHLISRELGSQLSRSSSRRLATSMGFSRF